MVTKTAAYPDTAIPPGEYLAEEIESRGLSQKELARRMGRPLNAINEIINGKKAITAETALQLEEVMPEIPARFWLNLETDYQLTKALISKRVKAA
jgi:HTH-type transcriptional regulator/antitoxin HigA